MSCDLPLHGLNDRLCNTRQVMDDPGGFGLKFSNNRDQVYGCSGLAYLVAVGPRFSGPQVEHQTEIYFIGHCASRNILGLFCWPLGIVEPALLP